MGLINLQNDQQVGVPEIDAQHEAMVGLINDLHQAMSAGAKLEELGDLIDLLVVHAHMHFQYEEQLMQEHAFPGLNKHREEHERLLAHIEDLAARFHGGEPLLSFAVMVDLKGWALVHIETYDVALGAFLNRTSALG